METCDFQGCQGSGGSGCESGVEGDRANAFAVEGKDLVADGVKHALHLMVSAFVNRDPCLARGENFENCGACR